MPTSLTSEQIKKLREAQIDIGFDQECTRIITLLDRFGLTLNWTSFVALIAKDTTSTLRVVEDFMGALNPKP